MIYLLGMAVSMQRLFRQFGHIQGYHFEVLLILCFVSYFCGEFIFWDILDPTLFYLAYTSDYECDHAMKMADAVFQIISYIEWPLSFQIIFTFLT